MIIERQKNPKYFDVHTFGIINQLHLKHISFSC